MFVNKAGITITITESLTQGSYVTGDPWVVKPTGTATVTAISPPHAIVDFEDVASDIVQNGAMINPVPMTAYCFTNGPQVMAGVVGATNELLYDSSLDVARNLPESLTAGDVLVCSMTRADYNPNGGTGGSRNGYLRVENPIDVYVPLSVVAATPDPGDFRPGLFGTTRKYYNVADVDYTVISDHWITPISSSPTLFQIQSMLPPLCWLEWYFGSGSGCFLGSQNTATATTIDGLPSTYGREIATKWGDVLSYLLQEPDDVDAWEACVNQVIQVGLDIYFYYAEDGYLIENGGQKIGRKGPLFLAAVLLNDSDMLDLCGIQSKWPEDRTTFIVQNSDVGRYVVPPRVTYGPEHVGLGEWGQSHYDAPENDNSDYNAAYRGANWPSLSGSALFARYINKEIEWGHPPFFACAERFMAWATQSGFVADLWYRDYASLPSISPSAATFSTPARIVESGKSISLASATAGADIFWSDYGEASELSTEYSGPITLTESTTIYTYTSHVDYATGSRSQAEFQVIEDGTPPPPYYS